MFTFEPLAAVPVSHVGFGIVVATSLLVSVMYVLGEEYERGAAFVAAVVVDLLICLFAYCVSYVWTDQTPKTYANTPVTAKFVEFVAEGYAVDEKHGKSTYRVDKHEQYVVYSVDGQRILLRAGIGQTYPENVILYKN